MTKDECFNLGYISRRVGNFGELAIIMDVDSPERYKKMETIFIEINNTLVPFFIKKISLRSNTAVVTIDGIDSIEKAEELVKSSLYLPLSMLPPLKGKKFYFHEIPGFTVTDKIHGNIGVVEKVLDFPQQVILQIKHGEQEILIPAKEEFIISIDRNAKNLNIAAPEGLIDLYLNPENGNEEPEA